MENKLVVFKNKAIRRTLHNNEWWFSIADVIEALTDSADPRQYIKKMRRRDPEQEAYWGTNCTPLEMVAPDGKKLQLTVPTPRAFSVSFSLPPFKKEERVAHD